ncbi:MAG: YbdD/YjiX family protein [Arenimonas sp.]
MWLPEYASLLWKRAKQSARSVIGVPDYETYLRHCREHHPERIPMSYSEFFTERQTARYKGTGGRCC